MSSSPPPHRNSQPLPLLRNILPTLSKGELFELLRLYRDHGDISARNRIVEANLPLVVTIARSYSYPVPLEDLVQAGALGLIRALETYDPDRSSLSTYASHWIRHHIQRSVFEGFAPLPRSTRELPREISLDALISSKSGPSGGSEGEGDRLLSLGSILEDEGPSPEEEAVRGERQRQVREEIGLLWKELDERERSLLTGRLMEERVERITLRELGEEHEVSRERMRQIEVTLRLKVKERLVELEGVKGLDMDVEEEVGGDVELKKAS